jgi:hypothetical protein
MRTRRARWGILAIALLVSAGAAAPPAVSHHSFAMYDQTIERTLTGRLVRFVIGANHSQFVFDVVDEEGLVEFDESGQPVRWQVETGPAASLARQGITIESFPIDTIFTVRLNPLRSLGPAGAMQGGIVLCGKTMPAGGCTATTGQTFGG